MQGAYGGPDMKSLPDSLPVPLSAGARHVGEGRSRRLFVALFWICGMVVFASVALYGAGSLLQGSQVNPEGFIPKSLAGVPKPGSWLTRLSPLFVLLYAFAFLPVVVSFTIAKFKVNPLAMILAACLLGVSLLLEIINALPMVCLSLVHLRASNIPPDLLLYLLQTDAVRFLAFDVAGFSLAYAGLFVYALVFRKTHRVLSGLIIASILLFVVNVPFLWVSPVLAVILMAASIFAFSLLPLLLVRMTLEEKSFRGPVSEATS